MRSEVSFLNSKSFNQEKEAIFSIEGSIKLNRCNNEEYEGNIFLEELP